MSNRVISENKAKKHPQIGSNSYLGGVYYDHMTLHFLKLKASLPATHELVKEDTQPLC